MKILAALLFGNLLCQLVSSDLSKYTFPKEFLFGVGSSAYQIEGAYNEDGKVQSIIDYIFHNTSIGHGVDNGDVAADSYHKWLEDVQLINELKVDFYRFSIPWTRILPFGLKDKKLNEKGVAHYSDLIDALLERGIIPMVTILHFDVPQYIKENDWTYADFIDEFRFYANTLFKLYGDRVKNWITINEPFFVCAASLSKINGNDYECKKNMILAHGLVYRDYEQNFKSEQRGKIGIALDSSWYEPKSDTSSDKEVAERALQFYLGFYMHPLVKGNYSPEVIQRVDTLSEREGFTESRLSKFTEEQIELVKGSFDFVGINHYSALLTTSSDQFDEPSFSYDVGIEESLDPSWEVSKVMNHAVVPWGFRKLLVWIKQEYNNPPIHISENGWVSEKNVDDTDRISYVNKYLSALLEAIHEDGCNILGYSYWSIIDNYEWIFGFKGRFGLVEVDFDNPNRTRTPRESYRVYQKIISSRRIN